MDALKYDQPKWAAAAHAIHSTAGAPQTATTGTNATPTAGTVYWTPLYLPHPMLLTGAGYLVGTVGGTDKAIVALYNALGVKIANSAVAGTTVGTAAECQEIAFTATYEAANGLYFVSVSMDGNTARFRTSVAASCGVRGGSAAGVFGTLDNITPATTAAVGPYVYVY